MEAQVQAQEANAPQNWDGLWEKEQIAPWRAEAQAEMQARILELAEKYRPKNGHGRLAVDVGGGIGALADLFKDAEWDTLVIDHSQVALQAAARKGHNVQATDLEQKDLRLAGLDVTVATCTEVVEHLSSEAMHKLLGQLSDLRCLTFVSVPNNCLGPDEEPQHARKLTTVEFLELLRPYFPDARVEYFRHWQMAVCNAPAKKETVSVCFPARDEAEDIERVLKSFRSVADQMVVGVDPRSTDRTREIAEAYAEVVFDLEDPQGKNVDGCEDDRAVHFSHIRNQCIDRCTGDWIFMTEAHEELAGGHDVVRQLGDLVPEHAVIGMVFRTAKKGAHLERWGYPWLIRRSSGIRFTRRVHNIPDYAKGTYVIQLPQISTLHDRAFDRSKDRAAQRKVVNRKTLMEDWVLRENESSLFYLGNEWRVYDPARGIERLEQLLALPPKNGPMRYQARLVIAITHMRAGRLDEARTILLRCPEDDWCRSEHWMWLGDIAFDRGDHNEALQFYRYAAAGAGQPPFTMWWIELPNYTYLPAQRLAMCYSVLGDGPNALHWARRVIELLPEDAPSELVEECERNSDYLRDIVEKTGEENEQEASS